MRLAINPLQGEKSRSVLALQKKYTEICPDFYLVLVNICAFTFDLLLKKSLHKIF